MFREVPVLPVVVPLAVVVLSALLLVLRRRRSLTWPRATVALAVAVYAAGIVANTVFPIYLDRPPVERPWGASLALVPLRDYEVADALMNVLVFVPVGVLAALVLRRPTWLKVLAVGGAVSALVEVTQLVTARLLAGGHVADVDDLLSNVVGALVGLGLLRLTVLHPAGAALVERFRWS